MIKLNGTEIKPTIFPDKTSQVWQVRTGFENRSTQLIEWIFESESEFMHVAQLKNLLDHWWEPAILLLPYLPYGRQDKKISNDATFALRTFIELLRTLNFLEIRVVDPHSNLILEKLDNCTPIYPDYKKLLSDLKPDLICYPDDSARLKYDPMINPNQSYDHSYFWGEKVRDQATGRITSYNLKIWEGLSFLKDQYVLQIDDIIDGGATFCILAQKLKECGVKRIDLFATHALLTKTSKPLKDAGIDRIWTYDRCTGYKEVL